MQKKACRESAKKAHEEAGGDIAVFERAQEDGARTEMMTAIDQSDVTDTNSIDLGPCWIVDKILSRWMPDLQYSTAGLKFLQVTYDALKHLQWGTLSTLLK